MPEPLVRLPELTFTPLSRNRYRVNDDKPKPTIIKKAQIGNYRRSFYGRFRRKLPKSVVAPAAKLIEVKPFMGYATVPSVST